MATTNTNDLNSTYPFDSGHQYMNQQTLQTHQPTNARNGSTECSFCEENFPTSDALRQHLLLCGNKTDECPKCRRLIRRSHFAYHYQNNCALVDEIETPPNERKPLIIQRSPVNRNRPVARVDVPHDDHRENYPPQQIGRIQSPGSNQKIVRVIIKCQFCQQPCAQNDYQHHINNCLRNPSNINNRQQPQKPLQPNQNRGASNGIVHIPCEICNELVDLPNWSSHVQSCRERDMQRMKNRARSISKEPIIEGLPCDHCKQLYGAKSLHAHERNCPRNPQNMQAPGRIARPGERQDVVLPVKSRENIRPPRHAALYDKVDVDETHAANRLNHHPNEKHPLLRRSQSDERIVNENASPRNNRAYGNGSKRSKSHDRLYQSPWKPVKHGSPNGALRQRRPSMEKLQKNEPNEDPSRTLVHNRSPHIDDRKHKQHIGHKKGTYEVINNDADTPLRRRTKKRSWWKRYVCVTNRVAD